jgi:hypothetical protein
MATNPEIGADVSQPSSRSATGTVGVAGLTILALLAIVDAAIETFWTGSPVRWWFSPPALAFAGLSVWIWKPGGWAARRWGWGGASTSSIGGLLIMLAAAAWFAPAGAAGVRMLARDAMSVLCLGAALVVLLVVVGTARARILPLAGVVTVAALGAYAVTAFVMAFRDGAPLQAVVAGAGFWGRLPVYLQGAFLGAFLILPLSVVLEALAAFRRHSNPWRSQQIVSTVLVVAIAASAWTPGPTAVPSRPADRGSPLSAAGGGVSLAVPSAGETPAAGLRMPERATFDAQRTAADSAALVGKVPAARYDLVTFARSLGPGVDAPFSFVRDAIGYEPYPGILRGSWSTYLTRAGNAADRSLLLGTLLGFKGITVRYVTGRLDAAAAERLFEHVFDAPKSPESRPPTATAQGPASAVPDLVERVYARARRDYAVVRTALGTRLPPASRPSRPDVLKEIEQHVWVQAQVDGRWVDLDSAFPDATVGRSYAAVARTFDTPP